MIPETYMEFIKKTNEVYRNQNNRKIRFTYQNDTEKNELLDKIDFLMDMGIVKDQFCNLKEKTLGFTLLPEFF